MNPIEILANRLRKVIGRGRGTTVDDSGPTQKMQVTAIAPGDVQDNMRRVMEYGFSSVPPSPCGVITLSLNGEPSNSVIIGTNHVASRPKNMAVGEVCLHDVRGQKVLLTDSGIRLTAPIVEVSETLRVGNGASGTFTTPTGQTVTVQDGIVTNIF